MPSPLNEIKNAYELSASCAAWGRDQDQHQALSLPQKRPKGEVYEEDHRFVD
jgi:hypothetical protein